MSSYKPGELFDGNGRLNELRSLAPTGQRRMGANPHANGGLIRKALKLPDFQELRGQGALRANGHVLFFASARLAASG